MKTTKKDQSTQTDESGGAKMSVKDQTEISRHIDIKKRIGNLEDMLHELRQRTKSFDPDDVPCAIDMEICRIEQELCEEYAKLGVLKKLKAACITASMMRLSDDEKEKWK